MKIGRECSFWELYSSHSVNIPQIQRDYIQGRSNPRVEKNRKNFIKELVYNLLNNRQMNLNFIYGYYENGKFVPIDGQQRLTTLFLMHLYIFSKSGHISELQTSDHLNFTYQTRYTTNRFLEALYNNILSNSNHVLECSNVKDGILNSAWFSHSWNNDPSVTSSVVVLNDIDICFKNKDSDINWEAIYQRLIVDCPIRFMLLEMEKNELGKPNQLYIRMNSRGKQLTDFENFKAALYGYIDESEDEELKELKIKISKKIDTDWQTMIWEIPDSDLEREKFSDIFYRDLIHWIIINRLYICNKIKDEDYVRPNKKEISNVFLENYVAMAEKDFTTCLKDLLVTMNALCEIKESDKEYFKNVIIKKILKYYFGKKNSYVYELSAYKPRVLLFAITKFATQVYLDYKQCNEYIESFKDWFRIVDNLTNNTEIDDPQTFYNVCNSINSFNGVQDISTNAQSITNFSSTNGFNGEQIKEEIFKQELIIKGIQNGVDWKNAILESEQYPYFQGEILFSFRLAGVDHNKSDNSKLQEYKNLWSDIVRLMEFAKENDVLFHRALLTYGDYSVFAPGKSDIITFFKYSEQHHKYDWRGMLRDDANKGNNCFASFLNACVNRNPADVANDIIESFKLNTKPTMNPSFEEIRYYLIKCPKLFEYCKANYYIWHDTIDNNWDRFLLMSSSRRTSYKEIKSATFQAIVGKSVNIGDTGNPYDAESRKRYLTYKNTHVEYRKEYFIDGEGTPLKKSNSDYVKTVQDLIEYFNINKSIL